MDIVKPFGSIYIATCILNGKSYIGQTTFTVEERWVRHIEKSGRKFAFGKALVKHGPENFTLETLDTATNQEDLDQKEIFWIKTKGTLTPAGYNLTEGGLGGRHSQESKDKMSASRRGKILSEDHRRKVAEGLRARYAWERSQGVTRILTESQLETLRTISLGKTFTPEHRAKISASNHGRKRSPEACEAISKGKKGKPNGNLGKKRSPESIEKMRQAHLGRKASPETKAKMSTTRLGRKASPETKAKMSASLKRRYAQQS